MRYLKDNPAADEHSEFDHGLADEYQDLNMAEQTAIAYLPEAAHICLVGDNDQSIYSFEYDEEPICCTAASSACATWSRSRAARSMS